MSRQESREDSPFGTQLNEFLQERKLNRKQLALLMGREAAVVTRLSKDTTPTPSTRIYVREIIEVLHKRKPLTVDEANSLLITIPTMGKLDARDGSDCEILKLLSAFDHQKESELPATAQEESEQPATAQEESGQPATAQEESGQPATAQEESEPLAIIQEENESPAVPQEESGQPATAQEESEPLATIQEERGPLFKRIAYYFKYKEFFTLFVLVCGIALLILNVVYASLPILAHISAPVSSSTPLITPPAASFAPLLFQSAPNCNNPSGTTWVFPLPATRSTCSAKGLLMQKMAKGYYAETDLDDVDGTPYDQTKFRTHVQVRFQNPDDTSTRAAFLVQTPQAPGVAGGYICTLNSSGQWQLLRVDGATNIPVVRQGAVTIDLSRPTTITVEVLNGTLYCGINGVWVISWPDKLNLSPSSVSLMVLIDTSQSSSPVEFSQFELDQ